MALKAPQGSRGDFSVVSIPRPPGEIDPPARVPSPARVPPGPLVCPWCDGTGRYRARFTGRDLDDFVVCTHPPPSEARAKPGAVFSGQAGKRSFSVKRTKR